MIIWTTLSTEARRSSRLLNRTGRMSKKRPSAGCSFNNPFSAASSGQLWKTVRPGHTSKERAFPSLTSSKSGLAGQQSATATNRPDDTGNLAVKLNLTSVWQFRFLRATATVFSIQFHFRFRREQMCIVLAKNDDFLSSFAGAGAGAQGIAWSCPVFSPSFGRIITQSSSAWTSENEALPSSHR